MTFALKSTAFQDGAKIPKQYTCDGNDISPPLSWSDPPKGTESFVLISDDPDAPVGNWVHWVLFNLPAEVRQLPENVSEDSALLSGALQGINDFRRTGYGGPCPPPGSPHRYFFKLYALDAFLELPQKANKDQIERTMEEHILGQAQLIGLYGR